MKEHISPAFRLTLIMLFLFAFVYPLAIWSVAQLFPGKGKGITIEYQHRKHYVNIGQSFTDNKYFWSRPSAIAYNAAGSAGSNKGPSNPEYLQEIKARIDTFLVHNPEISKSQIPTDLVTASGSGLDPDISVSAARIQIKRIAAIRKLNKKELNKLVDNHVEHPLMGLFGPEKVNVLKLNIALDSLEQSTRISFKKQ